MRRTVGLGDVKIIPLSLQDHKIKNNVFLMLHTLRSDKGGMLMNGAQLPSAQALLAIQTA